jgi:hypothetical protein
MGHRFRWCAAGLALLLGALPDGLRAQLPPVPSPCDTGFPPLGKSWRYRLLPGSYLVDDCLICGRPTLFYPLHGTFELVRVSENPLFSRFELREINWATRSEPEYRLSGEGRYEYGGEVAVTQELVLKVQVKTPDFNKAKTFTNEVRVAQALPPALEIHLDQTDENLIQFFRLDLVAAPVREIWFSTVNRMTAGIWPGPDNVVTAGDLLSDDGRLVIAHDDLLYSVRVEAGLASPEAALDALDIGPGGEIFFSLRSDTTSTSLGEVHHGDLLSDRGRVVKTNRELLAAFQPPAGTGEVGLDAAHVRDDGEILFSTTLDVASEKLGVKLTSGDLLSDKGQLVKSNKELLAAFQPAGERADYGLDALYLWPSGEIWFSTETGFRDASGRVILAGDLLSTQGRVIYGNLDLVSAFQPLEDLADFGLDAVFVVADAICPAPPPRLVATAIGDTSRDVTLRWAGPGRVFQVERAEDVRGPYVPVSAIVPGQSWSDIGAARNKPAAFYRLREW